MLDTQRDPIHPGRGEPLAEFPHAPIGWSPDDAIRTAQQDGLTLSEEHWQVIRALQDYYARNDETGVKGVELHDALEERFHAEGGMKYLYRLFPKGPVAQGCALAGLTPPAGAIDLGFGSVM